MTNHDFPMNPLRLALALPGLLFLAACQPPDRDALTVQMSLADETPNVAKGTIVVDYSRAGARIVSQEGGPACAFILPGVDGTFTDDGKGALTARVQSKRGVRGPVDLIACRMVAAKSDATSTEIRQKLAVKLTEAEDSAGKVLDLTIPVAKARRTSPAGAATPASADAAAAEAAAAGEMMAEAAEKKKDETKAAKTSPPKPAVAAAPKPPAAAPAVAPARPAAPAPSSPAGAPAAAHRSVINNPAARASRGDVGSDASADADAGGNNNNSNNSPGRSNNDDTFDDDETRCETGNAYEVTARVTRAAGRLGALQFEIIYQGDQGCWVGRGASVACEVLIDGLAASNYPGEREVKVGLVSLQGFDTPADVVKCIFRTSERPTPGSFLVNITDASDTNTNAVATPPEMSVVRVQPI